jgi:hypothetical protein
MNIANSPKTTLARLEQRAEVSVERLHRSMESLDYSKQSDWEEVWNDQMDAKLATWARNELHRMQHQTTKSILGMT